MKLDIIRARNGEGGEPPQAAKPLDIGKRVRSIRLARGWTLDDASGRTELSRAAISKIERNEASPTFVALQKIARGFEMSLVELLGGGEETPSGRRSIMRAGEARPQELPNYELRVLVKDLKQTAFLPYETIVKARAFSDFTEWSRHDSEEFVYILAGVVDFYTEYYEPVRLSIGDSVYFDGRMGHAFVTVGEVDANMLCISAFRD